MSDGNTVPPAAAQTVQIPPGFTPSATAPPAVVADAPVVDVPPVPVPPDPTSAAPPVSAAPAAAPDPAAATPAAAPAPAPATDATVTLPAAAAADPDAAKPAVADSFAKAAQTDLDKATTALDAVDKESVQLDLDKQGVNDLLKLVSQARNLVDTVHGRAVNNLDVELQFGNNWVSDAISRRLREVAVGNEESAVNVIGDFMQVLFEVEETIRDAARNLERADDEAADAFGSAGEAKG
ncbi:hypothetical protein [Saccharothrix texasensis]|uniref:Uncharacterized protein n=1 Tax=Saccharothrix texasensis TaxID=103734 RepID=A0A3N1H9F5_9PSEU|nr:hypothetical protein [Saccharothrix texasensis]ROP39143.1 hypothetical protein EDD40_4521 [Saccharothrix texasensis]